MLSGGEIFLVIFMILVLFGAKKMPEFARALGRGLNEFRKATEEIKKELNSPDSFISKEIKEIKDAAAEIKNDISGTTSVVSDELKAINNISPEIQKEIDATEELYRNHPRTP